VLRGDCFGAARLAMTEGGRLTRQSLRLEPGALLPDL